MIVNTHKCTVSVLVVRGSQKPTYKKINDVEDLDNVLAEKNTDNEGSNNNDHEDHYSQAHKKQNTRQY